MSPGRDERGYRLDAAGGAQIRADVVEVSVFRRRAGAVEFLLLRRIRPPLEGSWQPVLGHCEPDEAAVACARRELREEVGLTPGDPSWLGFWALEQVRPFFVAPINAVVLGPRFAAQVAPEWAPRLNDEHGEARWIAAEDLPNALTWPGQKEACREILEEIVRPGALAASRLALPILP